MYKNLLVPIDGTPLAAATVDQAVAYAAAVGARLTFLHVRPEFGASSDGALLHALSPQIFATAAAGNARLLIAKAESAARAAAVEFSSRIVSGDRAHELILQIAHSSGCDLVFLASHGRHRFKGALHGSVTAKLLQTSDLPILVAAVERNMPSMTDMQRAVAMVRDEHLSLSAILHALLDLTCDAARPADPALLRAMLFYIEQFPEKLHHPKEEAFLFRKLRRRSSECDALLTELEHQHVAGASRFAELRRLQDAGDAAAFASALQDFARLQWAHMRAEESAVLPAALHYLQPDDWREIVQGFATNDDPRFDTAESFEELASRLLEMAGRRR
jgi:nucleotide-binding universal stress UspA family protein/hemerythrin-like domain-containing protein